MTRIAIAYDDTPHAADALRLGQALGSLTGAELILAHVHRADPATGAPSGQAHGRESFLRRQGERMLERAAEAMDASDAGVRRVSVAGTTTASALRALAERESVDAIVFGSARSGPHDRVRPGSATRRLMQSAPCAIAVAPAGYAARVTDPPATIAFAGDDDVASAERTAVALAAAGGGSAVAGEGSRADLLVLGSGRGAAAGQVMTGGESERLIQASLAPVLVLAHAVALLPAALDGARAGGPRAA